MAGEKRCARHDVPVQISGLKGKLFPDPRRGDRPDRLLYRKLLFERTCILQQRIELPIQLIAEFFAQEVHIL